jgi:hypothetical protein
MRLQVEQRRAWLEQLAESVAGRKITVTTVKGSVGAPPAPGTAPQAPVAPNAPVAPVAPGGDLRSRAMADDGVQALLDVFPAEIRDVEEIK